jgi:hypothetical protein
MLLLFQVLGVCLADACDPSPTYTNIFSHAQFVNEFFVSVMKLQFFF